MLAVPVFGYSKFGVSFERISLSMSSCRKRAPNFSAQEETRLLELVTRYKGTIECRRTDTVNNKLKGEAWESIALEFNSHVNCEVLRTSSNLRSKYENLKKVAKDTYSEKKLLGLSDREEDLLIGIVEKHHLHLAENNTTIRVNIWEQIAVEFNEMVDVARDKAALFRAYENLKEKCTQKLGKAKKEHLQTGGGRNEAETLTPNEEKLHSLLGDRMTGFESSFDCDSYMNHTGTNKYSKAPYTENDEPGSSTIIRPANNVQCSQENSFRVSDNGFLEEENSNEVAVTEPLHKTILKPPSVTTEENSSHPVTKRDWSNYTPAQLRQPKAAPLKSRGKCERKAPESSRSQVKDKISLWAKAKLELTALQKEAFLEEHKMKIKVMQDKARTEIALMERESNVRIKLAEEEAALKREILFLEKEKLLKSIADR